VLATLIADEITLLGNRARWVAELAHVISGKNGHTRRLGDNWFEREPPPG